MATEDIQTSLYNGKHSVEFRAKAHRYYIDKKSRVGVTTVLSKVLSKPALMLWPLNTAIKHLENLVPNITLADLEIAAKAYTVKRDAGSDTGSIVHSLVEQRLVGREFTVAEIGEFPAEVALALGAFEGWYWKTQPKTIAVENVVYSETLEFAGTFDSILEIDGKVYLCDLKTTNSSRTSPTGVYPENFIQLGGYAYAYEEQRLFEEANGGTELRKIDDLMIISAKKDGHLHTKTASELGLKIDHCMDLWECVFTLYNSLGNLGKALGRST